MTDGLSIWTIYYGASDMPAGVWRVRRSTASSAGIANSLEHLDYLSLEAAREPLIAAGLGCIARHPSDEPQIVECWL